MVLTPGALVIVAMAPFIVRLTPIVGAKRLIAIGFFFLAVAVWHVGHLALNADYGVSRGPGCCKGLGWDF
jgi:DHA2 family multidrug resistance protein